MQVAVIGVGHVGASVAVALLQTGAARELLLHDHDHARAELGRRLQAVVVADGLPAAELEAGGPAGGVAGRHRDVEGVGGAPDREAEPGLGVVALGGQAVGRDVAGRLAAHRPDAGGGDHRQVPAREQGGVHRGDAPAGRVGLHQLAKSRHLHVQTPVEGLKFTAAGQLGQLFA